MPYQQNFGQADWPEFQANVGGDSFNGWLGSRAPGARTNQQTQTRPSAAGNPYQSFRQSAQDWGQIAQPPAAAPPAPPPQSTFAPAQLASILSGGPSRAPAAQPQQPVAPPANGAANLAAILGGGAGPQPQLEQPGYSMAPQQPPTGGPEPYMPGGGGYGGGQQAPPTGGPEPYMPSGGNDPLIGSMLRRYSELQQGFGPGGTLNPADPMMPPQGGQQPFTPTFAPGGVFNPNPENPDPNAPPPGGGVTNPPPGGNVPPPFTPTTGGPQPAPVPPPMQTPVTPPTVWNQQQPNTPQNNTSGAAQHIQGFSDAWAKVPGYEWMASDPIKARGLASEYLQFLDANHLAGEGGMTQGGAVDFPDWLKNAHPEIASAQNPYYRRGGNDSYTDWKGPDSNYIVTPNPTVHTPEPNPNPHQPEPNPNPEPNPQPIPPAPLQPPGGTPPGTPAPTGPPTQTGATPRGTGDPNDIVSIMRNLYGPQNAYEQNQYTRNFNAEAALTGQINSGGNAESYGRGMSNLIAQEGKTLADAIFTGNQNDLNRALQKYGIDTSALTSREVAQIQAAAQQAAAQTGASATLGAAGMQLQGLLASIAQRQQESTQTLAQQNSQFQATLAQTASQFGIQNNLDWAKLQAGLYQGDQNAQIQWGLIAMQMGLTPEQLVQMIGGTTPGVHGQP